MDALELSADKLKELQEKDDTLSKIREAAEGNPNSAGVGFLSEMDWSIANGHLQDVEDVVRGMK